MKECKIVEELLPQHISGDGISLQEEIFVDHHLKRCSHCQIEMEKLQNILKSTRDLEGEIDQVMETIDWEKNRSNILQKIEEEVQPVISINYTGSRIFSLRTGIAAASIFLVGILMGYIFFYSPQINKSIEGEFPNNLHSVAVIEKSFKENTIIGYLEQVRFYFLEILETKDIADINQDQNKILLAQTRYLQNSIKNNYALISAEEILQDIEFVLIEINQNSGDLASSDLNFIKELISTKRLVLKIHLTGKDIKNISNEV